MDPATFDRDPQALLSARQYEVFVMIAEGKSMKQVTAKCSCSIKTIGSHVTRVAEKLGVIGIKGIQFYAHLGGWVRGPIQGVSRPMVPITTQELLAIVEHEAYTAREKRLARACLNLLDRLIGTAASAGQSRGTTIHRGAV
jgi:DNA-binding CsgD family transcriptional regulator